MRDLFQVRRRSAAHCFEYRDERPHIGTVSLAARPVQRFRGPIAFGTEMIRL